MNKPEVLQCDALHPIITSSMFEELLLYNIAQPDSEKLFAMFAKLSGKDLCPSSQLAELSGGQKVLLMVCLALLSPAETIYFANVLHSLDPDRWAMIQELVAKTDKHILWSPTA